MSTAAATLAEALCASETLTLPDMALADAAAALLAALCDRGSLAFEGYRALKRGRGQQGRANC